MKRLHFILLLLIVFWQNVSFAQNPSPGEVGKPFLTTFDRKAYDASSQNWAVLQDKRGVIYVGNNQGVLEYNGATWRLIEAGGSDVRSLAVDDEGIIYVGGDGELGYLEPDSLGLLQYVSLLHHVPEDERDFGNVWFLHAGRDGVYFHTLGLLMRWDGEAMHFWRPETRFNTSAIVRDTLYVHEHNQGLYRMEADSLRLVPGGDRFLDEWLFVMLPFDDTRMLIGTRDNGFFLFDGRGFEDFPTEIDARLQTYTLYFPGAALSDGTFALGTMDAGVFVIDREGRLLRQMNVEDGLPNDNVHYLFVDNENGLWLALDNGIARVEWPAPTASFEIKRGVPGGVNDIARHDGTLYIATKDGVSYLDGSSGRFLPIAGADRNAWDLLATPEALFVATNGGLYRIRDRRADHWLLASSENAIDFMGFSLYRPRGDSTRLFVGLREGLATLRYMPGRPGQWEDFSRIPGIDAQVNSIHEDDEGRLWLGTEDGAVRITWKDNILDPIIKSYGQGQGLSPGSVWTYEAGGVLFFVTLNAVYNFDTGTDSFAEIAAGSDVSLEDAVVFVSFTDAGGGDLWMATKRGVERVKKDDVGAYRRIDGAHRRFAGWNLIATYAEEDGVTWFGGPDGLIRYDERVSTSDAPLPAPILHRVLAGADSVLFGGSGAPIQAEGAPAPELAYTANTLRFDFVSPAYTRPEGLRYRTFLEGFDDDWSAWSPERARTFTNLPESGYVFRVYAEDSFGRRSGEASYAFSIRPPWWRTWWAYLVYALLFAGVLYAASRVQRQRLIAKERLRAEREKARAIESTNRELQQALEHLTATQDQLIHTEKMASLGQLTAGIAHEIKNPLNFVNNFAEIAQEQAEEIEHILDQQQKRLSSESAHELKRVLDDLKFNTQKINEHGKRADGIIRSMLEHSRSDRGDRRPVDINKLVDDYINLAYHGVRARIHGFEVEIAREYDTSVSEVVMYPQEIGRVLINLLDNAFYAVHERRQTAGEPYTPRVSVATKKAGNSVEVSITDNGSGIAEAVREKIFDPFFTTKPTGSGTGLGLSLSHDIVVKGHGGMLTVESEEGSGSTFVLSLPVGGGVGE